MSQETIVIIGFARTPMGGMQGALSAVPATKLGSIAIKAAVERSKVDPADVDQVIMGCVLPGALGQAPARQAAIGAGLPLSTGATTINKVCGSGMKATMMAAEAILAGTSDIVVAGGMESMTNAPYMLTKHRGGARLGHDSLKDSMFLDGLEDAYDPGRAMGSFAEESCRDYQFTREAQDEYAIRSLTRANDAINSGRFDAEITPVEVVDRKGTTIIDRDEQPGKANPEKIPGLKAAFAKDGTITAANASSISDGAAALVVAKESVAKAKGLPIVARIVGWATHSQEPAKFTSAPVPAIRAVMDKAGWTVESTDLFEINEAFAMVPMIAMQELGIPADKVNINGGATALGHPIGASGARIIATLVAALQFSGKKRGVAALCIGGGEGTALAVELA